MIYKWSLWLYYRRDVRFNGKRYGKRKSLADTSTIAISTGESLHKLTDTVL